MILARNLSQTYESAGRSLTVLSPMDLTIGAQEIVAIVGPSGSGKTTLLGLLAGLDLPGTGSMTIDGQVLETLSEDQRAALRASSGQGTPPDIEKQLIGMVGRCMVGGKSNMSRLRCQRLIPV